MKSISILQDTEIYKNSMKNTVNIVLYNNKLTTVSISVANKKKPEARLIFPYKLFSTKTVYIMLINFLQCIKTSLIKEKSVQTRWNGQFC